MQNLRQAQDHFRQDDFEPLFTLLSPEVLQCLSPKQQAMGELILARAFKSRCLYPEAIACAQRAVQVEPSFVLAHYELGLYWSRVNQFKKAYGSFKKGSRFDVSSSCLQQAANCLKHLQLHDSAYAHYEACITRPCHDVFLLKNRIHTRKHFEYDADVADLQRLLKTQLPGQERQEALFAWAKAMEQQQDHASSFKAILEANRLHRHDTSFCYATCLNRLKRMRKLAFHIPQARPSQHFVPIFIVGLSRSGKSTLESLLAQHPKVVARNESCFVREWVESHSQSDQSFLNQQESLLIHHQEVFIRDYEAFMRIGTQPGQKVFIDTTPYHVEYLGALSKLFPQAKFIYCERDPWNLSWESYRKDYAKGYTYSNKLEHVRLYHDLIQCLVNDWEKHHHLNIMRVSYEQLTQAPLESVHGILASLGLSPLMKRVKEHNIGHEENSH